MANFHLYRVVSSYQPFPYAIKIENSKNIRLRNIHCYSDSKASFDNALYDQTHNVEIRQREFAWLTISGDAPIIQPEETSPVLAEGAKMEKVAGGFFNISGGAVDLSGKIYFVDAKWQTIYSWSPDFRQLLKVRNSALEPVQLAFDKADDLMVISYAGNGTVYSFKPESHDDQITLLKPVPSLPRPGMTAILPVDYWRNENDFTEIAEKKKPFQYLSPDGSTFIPAGEDFVTGELYYGSKMHDVLRAFGMASAAVGKSFYVSDEEEQKTYRASIAEDGTLTNLKLFVERGGESVAEDAEGNVYLAAGQIYVYDPSGKLLETIDVPERPSQLLFGGTDQSTLFILARSSLYAVQTRSKGR